MTEPSGGSDLAGIKTRAERDGEDWILTGIEDLHFQRPDRRSVHRRGTHGAGQAARTGFVPVERDMAGFRRGRNLKKLGLKAQDTSELFFDGVRVPARNVLGDPAQGFYYLAQFLVEERLIGACQYLGHSQAAFDLTLISSRNGASSARPWAPIKIRASSSRNARAARCDAGVRRSLRHGAQRRAPERTDRRRGEVARERTRGARHG